MKRKWLKRLAIAVGAIALLSAAIAFVGWYWVVPVVLRRQVAAAASAQWDGKLVIGGMDLRWTSPSFLHGVELRDTAGRKWLRAESVKLILRS